MLGLCRLFADDIPIGERYYDINTSCNFIDIDLNTTSVWSKQCLVKLNSDKTEIVYFNT